MKLAEALMIRGNLQEKADELGRRLAENAVVQEGEKPGEDPGELMQQADAVLNQLERLILNINLTNARTVADGRTLTEYLARREVLKTRIGMQRSFLRAAGSLGQRARGSEIKLLSTVPVAELQKQVDHLSQELRGLEIRIQELNWTTDLIED